MSRPSQYVDRTKPQVDACEGTCRDCPWVAPTDLGLVALQECVRYHVFRHRHRVVVRSSTVVVYKPKAAT